MFPSFFTSCHLSTKFGDKRISGFRKIVERKPPLFGFELFPCHLWAYCSERLRGSIKTFACAGTERFAWILSAGEDGKTPLLGYLHCPSVRCRLLLHATILMLDCLLHIERLLWQSHSSTTELLAIRFAKKYNTLSLLAISQNKRWFDLPCRQAGQLSRRALRSSITSKKLC